MSIASCTVSWELKAKVNRPPPDFAQFRGSLDLDIWLRIHWSCLINTNIWIYLFISAEVVIFPNRLIGLQITYIGNHRSQRLLNAFELLRWPPVGVFYLSNERSLDANLLRHGRKLILNALLFFTTYPIPMSFNFQGSRAFCHFTYVNTFRCIFC